jgi:hypothetical protein
MLRWAIERDVAATMGGKALASMETTATPRIAVQEAAAQEEVARNRAAAAPDAEDIAVAAAAEAALGRKAVPARAGHVAVKADLAQVRGDLVREKVIALALRRADHGLVLATRRDLILRSARSTKKSARSLVPRNAKNLAQDLAPSLGERSGGEQEFEPSPLSEVSFESAGIIRYLNNLV